MTLTIHKEENDQRELQLKVEVSEDQVEKAMRKKARELGHDLRFPGFRKGKVPYRVVLQRVGRNAVRVEAVEDMMQSVFADALDEVGIESYGRPTLDEMEIEPLILQFTIPLEPLVTLNEEYRAMRREIEAVTVTEEAVEEALEQVQIQHQTTEPVDRPVEVGDMVTVSGKGELAPASPPVTEKDEDEDEAETPVPEPEILFDQEHLDLVMNAEKLFPGTPFVDKLVGLSAGDETSFTVTFPADYEEEELAGRDAAFELTIIDVKSRDLPPLDDELAKLEGDYETLEEMRSGLSEQLEVQAQNQAKEDLIESTIDELMEDAVVQYPPAAVEMEIDEMIESFRNQVTRSGWEFDDYLTIQGSTEESLREDFRENAETRLRRRLVLRQFMLDEKLRVETEDVEAMLDERTGSIDNDELRQQMHNFYMQGAGFDMISSEVLSNKVYERIVAILSDQAPDLAELELVDEEEVVSEEE